ncbi:MAG: NAD(P)-dependent oxidoreductase [Chlorobiaceae bacterium]
MKSLPVTLKLQGKRVLVAGGGKAALEKVVMLQRLDCPFTVIAEEICEEMRQTGCGVELRPMRQSDLDGVLVLYLCSSDREANRFLKLQANVRGILVNTPDDPELCDFFTPAIYVESPMTVAVSSSGADVPKAIEWRNRIAQLLSADGPDA